MAVESPPPAFTPFLPPRVRGSGSYSCHSAASSVINFTPFLLRPSAERVDSCKASRPTFSDAAFSDQVGTEAEVIALIEKHVDISDDDDDDDDDDDADDKDDEDDLAG